MGGAVIGSRETIRKPEQESRWGALVVVAQLVVMRVMERNRILNMF